MKVLWVGAFRDSSGWSDAAANQVLALDAAGVDVVPRCVLYTGRGAGTRLPDRLLELEGRSSLGCDVVVQNVLPTSIEYDGGFRKNISYHFSETTHYRDTAWPRHLNLMDSVWVPCGQNAEAARTSGVRGPLSVVPVATDLEKYQRSYKPHPIRDELKDSFIFYAIGEATPRKNFVALVRAFHLEFDPREPVELLIKSNVPGMGAAESRAALLKELASVKADLNLYRDPRRYKPEHLITERLTPESLCRLHASCDCYVSASCGEGWGLPALDAMGFGKTPILTRFGAHTDYADDSVAWMVGYRTAAVTGMGGGLYSGRQSWADVDVAGLRAAMRQAYEDGEIREAKREAGVERVYRYGRLEVGRHMKSLLEHL